MSLLIFLSGGYGIGKIFDRNSPTGVELEKILHRCCRNFKRAYKLVVDRDSLRTVFALSLYYECTHLAPSRRGGCICTHLMHPSNEKLNCIIVILIRHIEYP